MNISILSDSVESLIGSIFLDSGYLSFINLLKEFGVLILIMKHLISKIPKLNYKKFHKKNIKYCQYIHLLKKKVHRTLQFLQFL